MADNTQVTFMVLVAGVYIQAMAKPEWTVDSLLQYIRSSKAHLSSRLKRLTNTRCNFYIVRNPVEASHDSSPVIAEVMASLKDRTKYQKVPSNKTLKYISKTFRPDFLHLVIEDPSNMTETLAKLQKDHLELYHCVQVEVGEAGQWTKDDIGRNGGVWVDDGSKPPKMLDLENKLCRKRSFKTGDDDPNLSIAQRYESHFATSYIYNAEDPPAVTDNKEFFAFYALQYYYLSDASRYKAESSSSLKAHAFKATFILPPFFSGRKSTDNLVFRDDMPWKFPLFVLCPKMSDMPRRYTPASDFSVWFRQLDLPLLIAEVVSERTEQDRYRMLLQAIGLARLAFYCRRTEATTHPFVVAIYLTAGLIAERYIVMKSELTPSIHIGQKNFDLTDTDDATAFYREMYNLASELESIVRQLDATRYQELAAFKKGASGMMSMHSSGAWSSTKKTGASTMDVVTEEEEGPEDEESLGVFDDDHLHADLRRLNYKVSYVAFQRPNIAAVETLTDGKLVGCLKFIKDVGKEIEIHQYLASLDFESNHTAPLIHTLSTASGTFILTPAAGGRLTKLKDKDTYLWPIMIQLFEAVHFMHSHGVAHMDLKPMNILVHQDYGFLTVIDFGISVRVKTTGQLFRSKGPVGTEGYIAPEVGRMRFSPILADLWSTGKVVEEFCMLCRPSPAREWLLSLSKQLLDDDPSKRPMMSEVLQRMLKYIAVANPGSDYISPVTDVPSRVVATSAPMYTPKSRVIEVAATPQTLEVA